MKARNNVMDYNKNLLIKSENKVREALEKVIDSIILVDSLEEIAYDSAEHEYREYRLMTTSDGQGIDYGGIEDVITVFNQWKVDGMDKTLRVFLEYEVYDFHLSTLVPTGINRQIGLVLKIVK